MQSYPRIVVSSTGRRAQGYHAALAAQEQGWLSAFFTTWYYQPDHWSAKFLQLLPDTQVIKELWAKKLFLRHLPGLGGANISCNYQTELLLQLAKLFSRQPAFADFFLRQSALLFDKDVARQLPKIPMDVFVFVNDLAASYSLPMVKKQGGVSVLISVIPHQLTRQKIISEEMASHPDQYRPIHTPLMENWFIHRNSEEIRQTDYAIATSPFVLQSLVAHGMAREKIFLLPRGLQSSAPRKITGGSRKRSKLKLLYVGRVTWLKGLWYLLQAMKDLPHDEVELVIVGACDDGAIFQDLPANVRYVPPVPHDKINDFYNNADAFVFPSLCEGSPTVVAEAMAAGLPIITTVHASGLVRDSVDGFTVPIRNPEALQEKILTLYHHPGLRQWMGNNAREGIKDFTWDIFRKQLLHVLEHIYQRGCLPPPQEPAAIHAP